MNAGTTDSIGPSKKNFRFFDNRQKYLMFVHTCGEKDVVAKRAGQELSFVAPSPPALRVFDGGIGDGTVLSKVLREMHGCFPTTPFYISGKEISLEDIRLSLAKMADRLFEHPATVVVFTNMFYSEAPWLTPRKAEAQDAVVWKEVSLTGTTAHKFDQQHSEKTGNPIYERPVALVLYREDHRFLLHDIIPKKGEAKADFDLVLASQPYRLRVTAEQKAKNVVAPLVRALRSGGRLLGIHSYGQDPGMELIQKIWPEDNPFHSNIKCTPCQSRSTRTLARQRFMPLGTLLFMSRRSKMTGWSQKCLADGIWRQRAKSCNSVMACGSMTRPM